eukprot:m.219475 g.219475  ORF g.219475 m.219475 type:complete len:74 (+) comp39923_c2_seq2:833-1054(+)
MCIDCCLLISVSRRELVVLPAGRMQLLVSAASTIHVKELPSQTRSLCCIPVLILYNQSFKCVSISIDCGLKEI